MRASSSRRIRFARPEVLWLLLLLPLLGLAEPLGGESAACARSRASAGRRRSRGNSRTRSLRRRWLGLAYPLALDRAHSRSGRAAVGQERRDRRRGRPRPRDRHRPEPQHAGAATWPTRPRRTRWQAGAGRGTRPARAASRRRGGHRVAVVVFAAHPKVLCPLTTDYDHVRAVIEDLDGQYPPPEIRPGCDGSDIRDAHRRRH